MSEPRKSRYPLTSSVGQQPLHAWNIISSVTPERELQINQKKKKNPLLSLWCLWDGAVEVFQSAQMQAKTGLIDQTGHLHVWQSWICCRGAQ